MEAQPPAGEFTSYAQTKLSENLGQIERCLAILTPEQIWHRPNDVTNAIGNLVLHLRGNVRQWIVSGLGGAPFDRNRPAEFAERRTLPTEQILGALAETVAQATQTIGRLDDAELARQFSIQGYEVSGLAAVFHVVEHFSLHTGQVVYATKILTGLDLSAYDGQGRRLDGRTAGVP